MNLRILYHHRIRADDGQAVHVREMITALRGLGHEVREVALVPKAATGASATPSSGGGVWRRLRLPRAATEVLEVLYNRRGRAMVREAARAFRPHFVFERHALHCRVGLDVARELDIPLLLEVNSPMTREMAALGRLHLHRRARATEREVLAGADRVLAVSRVLAGILVEDGARPEAVRVLPNAADPGRYGEATRAAALEVRRRLGVPEHAFLVVFVGYLRPWHRLERMAPILARPGFEHVHLLVVGDGPALPDIRARARRHEVGTRLHCVGAVPAELLPAHVAAADAGLIAAINGYASPLKLFDYLAAGVAVVAPRQPNLQEVLEDGTNALLFAPDDDEDLARTVATLVRDPDLRARLAATGRSGLHHQGRTWEGNARRVIGFYRELVP